MIYIILVGSIAAVTFAVLMLSRHSQRPASADIDLRRSARPKLTVQLPGHGPRLTITTPSKAMADACTSLGPLLTAIGDGDVSKSNLALLYSHCAAILADNEEHTAITVKRLERWLTPDDCIDLLGQYLTWLTGLMTQKN